MEWEKCRNVSCKKVLPANFRIYGFCNATCFAAHREEKDYEMQRSREAFRKEGEPNKGGLNA